MLAAKADWVAFISLWHYFCTLESSYSDYLTGNNNNYPGSELIT
jgi:hypothetical protein